MDKQHPLYQEDLNQILQTDDISNLQGKRFLITGATGLIGTCLTDALMHYNDQGADFDIYALGRSRDKAATRLGEYFEDAHFHFVEHDARQPLHELPAVDYIIPLASNTHPLAYSQYPIETIEINVKGAEHALLKAIECGVVTLTSNKLDVTVPLMKKKGLM